MELTVKINSHSSQDVAITSIFNWRVLAPASMSRISADLAFLVATDKQFFRILSLVLAKNFLKPFSDKTVVQHGMHE